MAEPDRLGWRSSHLDPPQAGQEVYYFGPNIGIGIGKYSFTPNSIKSEKGDKDIELCPHLFHNNKWGLVDACDAPHWQPYDAERAKGWSPMPPVGYMRRIVHDLDAIAVDEE
jgi:hypothetical protein